MSPLVMKCEYSCVLVCVCVCVCACVCTRECALMVAGGEMGASVCEHFN